MELRTEWEITKKQFAMKTIHLPAVTMIILLSCFISPLQAQSPQENWVLQNSETGNKTYVARDVITLKPGFTYTASSGNSFHAKIDPALLFPPTANTYAKPDGTITTDPEQGGIVGAIPYQFSVSPSGAATCIIPIECPVGINGMQPNISLAYNSQSGHGIAGWGWNIGGISAISRISKTKYYNDTITGIVWDNTSCYALDNQRLIEISRSLTDSIEYRTENESYNRIVAYNIQSWGPAYFKVYSKDGLTKTYGNPQSLASYSPCFNNASVGGLNGQNAGKLAWNLVETVDNDGNYMQLQYAYNENSFIGNVIKRIDYGKNKIENNATSDLAIVFNYEKRTDSREAYISGKEMLQQLRLKDIQTSVGGVTQKKYDISYYGENISRLQRIVLYQNGNRMYNPLVFTYGSEKKAENRTDISFILKDANNNRKKNLALIAMDLDGDGISEFGDTYITEAMNGFLVSVDFDIHHRNNGWVAKETFPTSVSYRDRQKGLKGYWGDFNGNGSAESVFAFLEGGDMLNVSIRDRKDHRQLFKQYLYSRASTYHIGVGNFHGGPFSGLIIIYGASEQNVYEGKCKYYYDMIVGGIGNNGTSITKLPSEAYGWDNSYEMTLPLYSYISDIAPINTIGHGFYNDLFIVLENGQNLILKNEIKGNGAFQNSEQISIPLGITGGDFFQIVDVNQDNLPDIVFRKNSNDWTVALNKGDYSFKTQKLNIVCEKKIEEEADNIYFYDINNDGLLDIIAADEQSDEMRVIINTIWRFYLNTGTGYELFRVEETGERASYACFGDFLGKGTINWVYGSGQNAYMKDFGYGTGKNLLTKISDSFTKEKAIDYNPLANHTKYDDLNDSEIHFGTSTVDDYYLALGVKLFTTSLLPVVTQYDDGLASLNYSYGKAFTNWKTEGFLGFESTEIKNETTGMYHVTENKLYADSKVLLPQGVYTCKKENSSKKEILMSEKYAYDYRLLGGKRFSLQLSETKTADDLKEITAENRFYYDSYGNLSDLYTTKNGNISMKTEMQYGQYNAWCPNKPVKVVKTNYLCEIYTDSDLGLDLGEESTDIREVQYKYDAKGHLTKEIADPGNVNQVTTDYTEYDGYGHPKKITVTANGISHSETLTYTSSGRFLKTKNNNQLNETTTYNYDETKGWLTGETTQLGTTSYQYDSFGRLTLTTYPDGIKTANTLQWAGNLIGRPSDAKYYSYTETSGESPVIVWYDTWGREIRNESYGLNQKKIWVDTEYNTKGQLYRISEPYFANGARTWAATHTYDNYGRIKQTVTPMGTTAYTYSGLTTTVASPAGTSSTETNAAGLVLSQTTNGKKVNFIHYASGLVKRATPESGSAVSMEYDLQGNRTKLTDPDAGIVESQYNGFGELLWERQKVHNANSYVTATYRYAQTGLLDSIVRQGNTTETTVYSYDGNSGRPRRIKSIEIPGQHKQSFSYDAYDRIINMKEEFDGKIFNQSTTYDVFGRIKRATYPSGYYTDNSYDKYGNITAIKDRSGRLIWQPLEENARGQVISEKRGNRETIYTYYDTGRPEFILTSGVSNILNEFDSKGNLTYRDDYASSGRPAEAFSYDSMNRLAGGSISRLGTVSMSYSLNYDAQGNIQTKSDLGSPTMNYGANGKPHALTSISNIPTNFPSNNLSVTYTDFKKIKTLTEGNKSYQITYGVDDQRRKSVYSVNSSIQMTRYYLGNYEEELTPNGNTRKIHYLKDAVYIQNTSGGDSLLFTYTDYLGSLTALTDYDGNVVERYAYDPWGRRRNPSNWSLYDTRTSFILNRGYTGHEHLDAFGIINMNGRVYDPLTASFFSPDPYIQAPGNWLNYNRYAYCFNNPFKYTDLTGEWVGWDDLAAMLIGGTINLITNWHKGITFAEGLSYFLIGAAAGEATLYAPESIVYFAAGQGSLNSVVTQGFNPVDGNGQGKFDLGRVDPTKVLFDGVIAGATTYVGGEVGKSLHVDQWYKGVKSPFLNNWLQSTTTNTIVGTGFGGLAALGDGNPNTTVEDGMWNGFKMGLATGTISGIGNAVIYSQQNNVNLFTGKLKNNISVKQELRYDTKQIGKKYGEHMKDYPGVSHDGYLNMAKEIYSDPLSTRITYPTNAPKYPGEIHYYNNGNLLRIAPDGTFRSLYPY
jgi:RHS repeat-associated protein